MDLLSDYQPRIHDLELDWFLLRLLPDQLLHEIRPREHIHQYCCFFFLRVVSIHFQCICDVSPWFQTIIYDWFCFGSRWWLLHCFVWPFRCGHCSICAYSKGRNCFRFLDFISRDASTFPNWNQSYLLRYRQCICQIYNYPKSDHRWGTWTGPYANLRRPSHNMLFWQLVSPQFKGSCE